jgi:hypothetical protein
MEHFRLLLGVVNLLTGGAAVGWFYEPTVLPGITPEMPIFNEELFGQVAAICKVETFLEAITLANRSEFGLGANVLTTELSDAMQAVEDSRRGLDAFRQSKMAVIDSHPYLHDWWYPYPADVFLPHHVNEDAES